MPFEAATLQHLEDALSECLPYHDALDNFVIRAGVASDQLKAARARAEVRRSASPRGYARAPKRFVIQELLNALARGGEANDRATASLISNVMKGSFSEATPAALKAIELLKEQRKADQMSKEQERREKKAEAQARAREIERREESVLAKMQHRRDALKARFITLISEADPQKRGYLLEGFLNDFFDVEGLKPRSAFRIVGEQIDGFFVWRDQTHLVEAKWVKDKVSGKDFASLIYKIEGKTVDTRGLFVSINGYSRNAVTRLEAKGALRFVCIDGAHLMRCLEAGQRLRAVLETVWRHADETGEPYLPVNRFPQ